MFVAAWCGETRTDRVVDDREPVVVILDSDNRECCASCMEPCDEYGFCYYCA